MSAEQRETKQGAPAAPGAPGEPAAERHESPETTAPPVGGDAPEAAAGKPQAQAGETAAGKPQAQAGETAAGEPSDQVANDLEELVARAEKADEYLALAQRTQADFENFRKRVVRDRAEAEARGVGRVVRELLPALDNLALAVAAFDEGGESHPVEQLAEGVRLVHAELTAALGRLGVESYSPEGERFDPEQHEAMAAQPVEGAESGTIVQVYQQGYRIDGTVLRPARVIVAA